MRSACRRLFPLLLATVLCAGCAISPAYLYENQFDDLDIGGRINHAAYRLSRGETSFALARELQVILVDLHAIDTTHPTLEEINSDFVACVEDLIASLEEMKQGDPARAEAHYDSARTHYRLADNALNRFKRNMQYDSEHG